MTIGYKAFNKDMTYRGFQFEIGKTYEEKNISMCEKGFHFCLNPLDCLSYYDLTESILCEVESLGNELKHDEDSKICTDKIKITKKISHNEFIKLSESFLFDNCNNKDAASGDGAQLAASGAWAQLAASGAWAQLAASGDGAQLAASGAWAQLAASGNGSQLAASGDRSQLAASGDRSKLAASGNGSQLAASGNGSQLAASGDRSKLAASGNGSIVAAIGKNNTAKAKKGSFIVLAEYENGIPIFVKSRKVDGKRIKEDTFYKLEDGKFVVSE